MEEFDRVTIMPPKEWNWPDIIFSSDTCPMGCSGWTCQGKNKAQAFHA